MPPKRMLREIQTFARLNKKTSHVIVEGVSDRVIISSFCAGSGIKSIVYEIPEIILEEELAKVTNGNRGRVQSVSNFLRAQGTPRIFCVIDRDGDAFASFNLHSHCLITDFASIEMYSFDEDFFSGYVNRAYLVDLSKLSLEHILRTSRSASFLKWSKEETMKGVALASLDKSLTYKDGIVDIDIAGWVDRSRSFGGSRDAWAEVIQTEQRKNAAAAGNVIADIDIHFLDEIFRFWLRSSKGEALKHRWLEQFLRGQSRREILAQYAFLLS